MTSPTPADLRRWDIEHLWHPFTQMTEYAESDPLMIVAGAGSELIDDRGRRYLDATSALWCNLLGHRVREIDEAISAQVARLAHSTLLGATHPAAAELARRLAEIAPEGLTHVFFSDDGATAIEAALKVAFQYRLLTQGAAAADKAVYLSLENGYHGDTLGAAAVGGVALFHETFRPILLPTLKAASPYCYRCPLDLEREHCSLACAGTVEEILARENGRVCAVLVEPGVQAAAGMLALPEGYLPRVAAACRRHGALLVADEVATGFGRTGSLFACAAERVAPDLMCLAKGLTGGYLPVAATLATDEIYRAFLGRYDEYRHFFHGHTYTGNPLGCAAALATLGLLADGRIIADVPRKAALLVKSLAPLASQRHVGDIRQAGLMCGVELVKERARKTSFPAGERIGYRVCLEMRQRGIYIRPLGDVIAIVLPLTVRDDEIQRVAEALAASIQEVLGG
jgi:adenosylmethionine-8-amino-7-oxononanoate aminotransferase